MAFGSRRGRAARNLSESLPPLLVVRLVTGISGHSGALWDASFLPDGRRWCVI